MTGDSDSPPSVAAATAMTGYVLNRSG